ncbi:hypothetical protein CPG38_05760 [Malaciobacter marinus]|uniref:hypothetical protein n=1 Tax=Malaciobacter marinus TaxID=505249 RepID=UPI000C08AC5A|nr:hypothetical protein [Malaciobacter marinus]PHO12772.1 hypothetical protein CPG38_05760 [Malaciobacter marinus]
MGEESILIDDTIYFIDKKFKMLDFNPYREKYETVFNDKNEPVVQQIEKTIREWIIWTIKKAKYEIENYKLSRYDKNCKYPKTAILDIKRICYINVAGLLKFQKDYINEYENKNQVPHHSEILLEANGLKFDFKNKHKLNKFEVGSYNCIFVQQRLTSLKYKKQIEDKILPEAIYNIPLKNKHKGKNKDKYKYQNSNKTYQSFKKNPK